MNDRLPEDDEHRLPLRVTLQVDALCDEFESAFDGPEVPLLAPFVDRVDPDGRTHLLEELVALAMEHLQKHGIKDAAGALLHANESLRDELTPLIPDAAATALHSPSDAKQPCVGRGLHVRCPHCHNPIELVPDGALESIHCEACGSDFSLTSEGTETRAAREVTQIGHFKLVERIGMGAFGSVWKALDMELDRTVAIKIPRHGNLQQDAFLREARAAAQLHHPNIVPVHEVGRDGDSLYIVSDFIRGITLADWLTGQQLTSREAAELCVKIAEALHYAHEHGVIHRDLKPGNIMIGEEGEPHLMDFGLARREAGEITMTLEGQVLGTPAYMSPEQAQGEAHKADRRTDIYSMGVILFQLLTSELPFRGNARMLIHQVINDESPSPRKLNSNVTRDMETVCLKCLEKDPAKRYPTAKEVSEELHRFNEGEPILARPIQRTARAWRWCKRKPTLAALIATVLCLVTFPSVVAPIVALRESALRAKAIQAKERQQELRETAQRQAQQLTLEKAWSLPEQGRVAEGMLLLVRCLEIVPEDQTPLRMAIRANLAAWYEQLHPLHAAFAIPFPESNAEMNSQDLQASFIQDGSRVVITRADGQIRICDATTLHPIGRPLQHPGRINALAVSPDGRWFLTCGTDKTALLWNAKTLRQHGLALEHSRGVASACFSPDGSQIVTGSYDMRIRLWDTNTQQMIGDALQHDSPITAVAFGANGSRIVAIDEKGFHLWDARTYEQIGEATPYKAHVFSLQFSPKEPHFLVGSQDQTVRIRDEMTRKPIGAVFRHPEPIHAVAFDRNGGEILTGCRDGIARRWDVQSGKLLGSPMRHSLSVLSVGFSPDKSQILTASLDRTIRIWNISQPRRHGPLRQGGMVRGVAFSPEGKCAVTASSNGTVQEWNIASLKPLSDPILISPSPAYTAAYSPDGSEIAIGYSKGIRQWDRKARKWIRPILKPSRHTLNVTYSHDGRHILAAGGGTANVWRVADGMLRHRLGNFYSAVFNHDSSRILASSFSVSRPMVCIWDSKSGKELLRRVDQESIPWAVAFHPDGTRFLTGTVGGVLRIWDAITGEPLSPRLQHHESSIRCAAFSPDGKWIVTASHDRTARVWDVATGRTIGPPMEHSGPVKGMTINPDGTQILTGDGDGNGWLWDAPPPPLNGEVERIMLWVQVVTGMELQDGEVGLGEARLLDVSEWNDRRQRLEELGGPPIL